MMVMVVARTVERVSTRNAVKVTRAVKGMKLSEAERFLTQVYEGKKSIGGKYYTKTVEAVLRLLKSVRNNASHAGVDPDSGRLVLSASRGPTVYRARRSRFGRRLKSTYLEAKIEVEKPGSEENGGGKEVRGGRDKEDGA